MIEGILQDDGGDILLQNGDFVKADITQDIVADTMITLPGDFKWSPIFGAALPKSLNGKPDVFFNGRLRSQLSAQGIIVKKIAYNESEGTISVEI